MLVALGFLCSIVTLALAGRPDVPNSITTWGGVLGAWSACLGWALLSARDDPVVQISVRRMREMADRIERLPPGLVTPQAAANAIRLAAGGTGIETAWEEVSGGGKNRAVE